MVSILISVFLILIASNVLGYIIARCLIAVGLLPKEWIANVSKTAIWATSSQQTNTGIQYQTLAIRTLAGSAATLVCFTSPIQNTHSTVSFEQYETGKMPPTSPLNSAFMTSI